ncbi:Uncharacterized protein TCM_011505 [Theobroma cacao]|uniref:Uncharacterized protein n=1 Tax=Theobroma cacao TaxID=3641 RepID=A0A061EHC0_THECC|nr:Uncharacterized protein TCM_011505 [Theobroma cacao]
MFLYKICLSCTFTPPAPPVSLIPIYSSTMTMEEVFIFDSIVEVKIELDSTRIFAYLLRCVNLSPEISWS